MPQSTTSTSNRKEIYLAIGVFILLAIVYLLLPAALPQIQKQMTLIFLFAGLFWALEIIPLYATSLIIIIVLTATFSLFHVQGGEPVAISHFITSFSSPIIMLFLGGFILAAAANKHEIDKYLIEKMIDHLGNRSWVILVGYLIASAVFSLWVSNTAATAMMLLLAKPILTHLHKDDPLRKGLILAVAFGANAGGIGTPIGTPPNAIAIGIAR